jgi:hypothetical protein
MNGHVSIYLFLLKKVLLQNLTLLTNFILPSLLTHTKQQSKQEIKILRLDILMVI